MKGKMKVNICSLGDPTMPSTWSGTPFNLYSELVKLGILANAFDSASPITKVISKISIDSRRGICRYLNAGKVKIQTKKSDSNLTLHTGTLDLPFYNFPRSQKHYLFCDSTWDLWSKYAASASRYSKRMLQNIDKLESESYHQVEHIFPISEYVKNNLVEHYGIKPSKITVVGTGLGVIKPYYGVKNYSNGKILFAAKGRFEDKGGSLVLEAFKIALKNNPALELNIVGQNEYTKNILLPNVKTYGFLSVEELQKLFNESSLFLMPAINEPWGLVYLEALACRMPIVGFNRNSFPEISGNGKYGFILNELQPEKLAEILVNAFSDSEKLSEMGNIGQKYCVDKFSWSNTVNKIIKVIEEDTQK